MIKENKFSKYLLYAIGEIILVVIGILIALSINNWNENRKNQQEQFFILNKLQSDIKTDIAIITNTMELNERRIENFIFCLEVLSRKKEATKQEFLLKFGDMLQWNGFNQNTTTFDNLISSGKLELVENEEFSDEIVGYYTQDYKAWDSAIRDYTRNVIGPFLLEFDHIPQVNETTGNTYEFNASFYKADISSFDVKPKSLEDYRQSLFIINALRRNLSNSQGQLGWYNKLLKQMEGLVTQIENEKARIKT